MRDGGWNDGTCNTCHNTTVAPSQHLPQHHSSPESAAPCSPCMLMCAIPMMPCIAGFFAVANLAYWGRCSPRKGLGAVLQQIQHSSGNRSSSSGGGDGGGVDGGIGSVTRCRSAAAAATSAAPRVAVQGQPGQCSVRCRVLLPKRTVDPGVR